MNLNRLFIFLFLFIIFSFTILASSMEYGNVGDIKIKILDNKVLIIDVEPSYITSNGVRVLVFDEKTLSQTGYSPEDVIWMRAHEFVSIGGNASKTSPRTVYQNGIDYNGPGDILLSYIDGDTRAVVYVTNDVDIGRLAHILEERFDRSVIIVLHAWGHICAKKYDKIFMEFGNIDIFEESVPYVACWPPIIAVDTSILREHNMSIDDFAKLLAGKLGTNNFYIFAGDGYMNFSKNITWFNNTPGNVEKRVNHLIMVNPNSTSNAKVNKYNGVDTSLVALTGIVVLVLVALYITARKLL